MNTSDRRVSRAELKTLAFVIGLCIIAVGAVGMVVPAALVWIARHSIAPEELYFIAAFRIAFGVLLLWVASGSRAPRALRVVALIPFAAALSTPFVGVERAPALIEWWSQHGPAVVRLTAVPVLALGGFVAYACAPAPRAV